MYKNFQFFLEFYLSLEKKYGNQIAYFNLFDIIFKKRMDFAHKCTYIFINIFY